MQLLGDLILLVLLPLLLPSSVAELLGAYCLAFAAVNEDRTGFEDRSEYESFFLSDPQCSSRRASAHHN